MQEFDIKGKVSVTATVKAQVDDSPVALPPPFIKDNQEDFLQKEGEKPAYLNSAILEEFKDVLPELTRNLARMNEAVGKYNQSSIQNLWPDNKLVQNAIPSLNTEEQDIIKAEGAIISDTWKESDRADVSSVRTPGIRRMMLSARRAAGISPPLTTKSPTEISRVTRCSLIRSSMPL